MARFIHIHVNDEPQLLGTTEAAEVVGVSRATLTSYYRRGKLPEPVARLACGPVWKREDIEQWAAERRARG